MKCLFSTILTMLLLLSGSTCSSVVDSDQQSYLVAGVVKQLIVDGERTVRILVEEHPDGVPVSVGADKVWLLLGDQTEVLVRDGISLERVGRDVLKIGQEVRGWVSGMSMYSNPPQTFAMRIVIDEE